MIKNIFAVFLLMLSTSVLASSNCNSSSLTIVNNTDEPITIIDLKAIVYTYYEYHRSLLDDRYGYFTLEYNNHGRLRNITLGQVIWPGTSMTAYAFATETSGGDVAEFIQLEGSAGVIDIDSKFNSLLWGFGTCRAKSKVYSSDYDVLFSQKSGKPASAMIEINQKG